jgi:hypothetical protein
MLREEDIRIDIGRAQDGIKSCSFMRMVHLPTGIERSQVGFKGLSGSELKQRFLAEIEAELTSRGLTQHIVPDYPVKNRRQCR